MSVLGIKIKRWILVGVIVGLGIGAWPEQKLQAAPTSQGGTPPPNPVVNNLLQNSDFEGLTGAAPNPVNWSRDTFNGTRYREIYTPIGWVTFWREGGSGDSLFGRPECKLVPNDPPFDGSGGTPKRVYSGHYAALCFTFYRRQDAGFYQVVRDLPSGATVEASAYAHAWSCNDSAVQGAVSCGDPKNFQFQVGLDPEGGTDPWSPNIVWSRPAYPQDIYQRVGPVQVQAGSKGVVTLFLRGQSGWAFEHNDAYWDHASLVVTSPIPTPTATLAPPPPTPETLPTQSPVSGAPPPGAITHTVVEGDSLFGLAIQYGVEVDQLRQLNAATLGPNDLLSIDQVLIISLPADTGPTPTPEAPVSEVSTNGRLCLLAYQDRNGDTVYQTTDEVMLPGATLSVLSAAGTEIGAHVTDGFNEPYCFEEIPAGDYIVRQTAPQGYLASGGEEWRIRVDPGQKTDLELSYVRADITPTPSVESGPETPESSEDPASWMQVLGITTGILVVLGLAGGGFYFFRIRRKK